jgi:6-phosphogluconate dehydrogenase
MGAEIMSNAEIGLIGLGVMGSNLALNIASRGFHVAVYNRNPEVTRAFKANAGKLSDFIIPCTTLEALSAAIRPPRPVIIMVTAGNPVDQVIASLRPVLTNSDIILDAGNANFHDTVRRFKELDGSGLTFIGMGVSGGAEGARNGPSIMVGGTEASYHRVENVLTAIAAKYKKEPCCAWLGPDGAGHFVKTIHNGIEYADMQMISETYGIMRDGLGMKPKDMAKVFEKWNTGRLNSYLIEITAKVLAVTDAKTKKPLVDVILDRAGQKGTGKWSVIEAQTLGIPATTIEAAVAARVLSSLKVDREVADKAYKIPRKKIAAKSKAQVLRQLEAALYAGKIAAYAQGFAVLEQASKDFSWNIPLGTVAKIWREGCIIRSQFLGLISQAFVKNKGAGNLLMAPAFMAMMKDSHGALRNIVSQAALIGAPLPALSSALAYFDSYRQARGTANLIQGQRDFFGAHGFERIGETGAFHGPWGDGTQ